MGCGPHPVMATPAPKPGEAISPPPSPPPPSCRAWTRHPHPRTVAPRLHAGTHTIRHAGPGPGIHTCPVRPVIELEVHERLSGCPAQTFNHSLHLPPDKTTSSPGSASLHPGFPVSGSLRGRSPAIHPRAPAPVHGASSLLGRASARGSLGLRKPRTRRSGAFCHSPNSRAMFKKGAVSCRRDVTTRCRPRARKMSRAMSCTDGADTSE